MGGDFSIWCRPAHAGRLGSSGRSLVGPVLLSFQSPGRPAPGEKTASEGAGCPTAGKPILNRDYPNHPMKTKAIILTALLACRIEFAQTTAPNSTADAILDKFHPLPAPQPSRLLLRQGDRLAICGDSITEQRMYSRIMEDYLSVCVPELNITVRQYGWSGERAPQFLARMTNDCLRFQPTIATTCYGMNDHEYRPYEERIGQVYRESSRAIDQAFEAHGVRVIEGSPGCVGKVPPWTKNPNSTVEVLNLNLCTLRNIGIEVASQEKAGFADVFWP